MGRRALRKIEPTLDLTDHLCTLDELPQPFHAAAHFGLDLPLEALVNAFKSAAKGYGIEKRVLLLHGPVGSSKSTIARMLKKGLESYSGTDIGALFTLGWAHEDDDVEEESTEEESTEEESTDAAVGPHQAVLDHCEDLLSKIDDLEEWMQGSDRSAQGITAGLEFNERMRGFGRAVPRGPWPRGSS